MSESDLLSSRVAGLRDRLDQHRTRLAQAGADAGSSEPSAAVADLLEFVRSYDDREAYDALERAGGTEGYRAFFSPLVLAFTASVERLAREHLRSRSAPGPDRIEALLASNPWGAYAGLEQTLSSVDVSTCRSFAMIGCGPLPDSLLYLHEQTEIETLIGFDRDPAALRSARELVGELGLDRIRILDGDGLRLDYEAFDVICPSVFAQPRIGILERIANTARSDAVVILRDPFFTGTLLFERVVDALPAPLEVRAESRSRPGRFMLRRYVLGLGPRRRESSGR